jgi:hypothetical protein
MADYNFSLYKIKYGVRHKIYELFCACKGDVVDVGNMVSARLNQIHGSVQMMAVDYVDEVWVAGESFVEKLEDTDCQSHIG